MLIVQTVAISDMIFGPFQYLPKGPKGMAVSRINPDSFKGKRYLLLFEKILLGAVIAAAFIVYDRYKQTDLERFQTDMVQLNHRLEQERTASQQSLERARLLGELIPVLRSKDSDPLTRGYLLRSAVQTNVLDADGAVDLASSLFIDDLTQDQFARVMSVVVPNGIPAIAKQGELLSQAWRKDHKDAFDPGLTLAPGNRKEDIPEGARKIAAEGSAWRRVLMDAAPTLDCAYYRPLEDTATLPNYLYGLFVLLNPGDSFTASNLSKRSCRAIRLIGNIGGAIFGNQEANTQLVRELTLDHTNLDNIRLARVIVAILTDYGLEFKLSGPIADSVARVLTEKNIDSHLSPEVQTANNGLRFEAGEFLTRMYDITMAEPTLVEFVSRFRDECLKTNIADRTALEALSSRWDNGNLIRLAVTALGKIHTDNASRSLHEIAGLGGGFSSEFPFLMEDVERSLNGKVK